MLLVNQLLILTTLQDNMFLHCHLSFDEDVHPHDCPELKSDWITPTEGANLFQVNPLSSMTRNSTLTSVREGGMIGLTSVQAVFQAVNHEVRETYWIDLPINKAFN